MPEVVPGFCVRSIEEKLGCRLAEICEESSAAITGGDSVTFDGPTAHSSSGQHAFRQRWIANQQRHAVVKFECAEPPAPCPMLATI